MIINKKFPFYDYEKEQLFLSQQAKNGWLFSALDAQGYHFQETESQIKYFAVEFYQNYHDIDFQKYQSQQAHLQFLYKGEQGSWAYFMSDQPIVACHDDEKYILVERLQKRLSNFWAIIGTSLWLFSLYYGYSTQSVTAMFFILITSLFLICLGLFYLKLKKLKQRMSYGSY